MQKIYTRIIQQHSTHLCTVYHVAKRLFACGSGHISRILLPGHPANRSWNPPAKDAEQLLVIFPVMKRTKGAERQCLLAFAWTFCFFFHPFPIYWQLFIYCNCFGNLVTSFYSVLFYFLSPVWQFSKTIMFIDFWYFVLTCSNILFTLLRSVSFCH